MGNIMRSVLVLGLVSMLTGPFGCKQDHFDYSISSMIPSSRSANMSSFILTLDGTFPQAGSQNGLHVEFNHRRPEVLTWSEETITCRITPDDLPSAFSEEVPVRIAADEPLSDTIDFSYSAQPEFSQPVDLGDGDGYTIGFDYGGTEGKTLVIASADPSDNGWAATARARRLPENDPDQVSEDICNRGENAKIGRYWLDSTGARWLWITSHNPENQREWIVLERTDPETGEVSEHLLGKDLFVVHWPNMEHSPSGGDFLIMRGGYGRMMLLRLGNNLPDTLEPIVLPFNKEYEYWLGDFIFSPDGRMVVVWNLGFTFAGDPTNYFGTQMAWSEDEGHTWSEAFDLPDLASGEMPLKYRIRFEDDGTITLYLTTRTYSNYRKGLNQCELASLIRYSGSADGLTWDEKELSFPMPPKGAVFRHFDLDENGNVNLIWSTDRQIHYNRSCDGGSVWNGWVNIDMPGDWLVYNCDMTSSDTCDIALCIRAYHPGDYGLNIPQTDILFSSTRFRSR